MAANRLVGRLWCFDVLARLSAYLDGELTPEARAQVDEHLAHCDECTRFGGEFGAVVGALRAKLQVREPMPDEVAKRLERALLGG